MFLRCRILAITMQCAIAVAIVPGESSAEDAPPAVRGVYAEALLFSYAYTDVPAVPPVSSAVANHRFSSGFAVTLPLGRHFGARVGLDGGGGLTRSTFGSQSREDGYAGISTGADVFWRTPRWGELGIGYRYSTAQGGFFDALDSTTHGVRVEGAAFVGPVDVALRYGYDARDTTNYSFGVTFGSESSVIDGLIEWYALDSLSVGFASGWTKNEQERSFYKDTRAVHLRPQVTWLLPTGSKRYASIQVWGSYRFEDLNLLMPAGTLPIDSSSYSVGFAIRLHFPGVESLMALSREVR